MTRGIRIMKCAPAFLSTLLSALALSALSPASAAPSAQSWFGDQGFVPPSATMIVACHGYGCSRRAVLDIDGAWLSRARTMMSSAHGSPEAERRAIGEVVRAYTAYLARQFGGAPDAPRSPPQLSGQNGQMDCVDETANTTSLLLVLEGQGLLAHHIVERPQSRGLFIDGRYPHVTAIIAEKRTGREWAVDPWTKAPGQWPDILPLSQWRQDS
ncbi:hypothetical protein [Microvirga terricola]|uniref:Transglutaminase-like cysteine proteinase BTLCP n=1 Tax=Microvirga terricola TaxID=2719797 RepID=A0ABX0V8I3_9HYPH|nr:hypothetical protein [Microvirga terricola]NIX76148.1 hypothetical protein [Microvirga terricola]